MQISLVTKLYISQKEAIIALFQVVSYCISTSKWARSCKKRLNQIVVDRLAAKYGGMYVFIAQLQ